MKVKREFHDLVLSGRFSNTHVREAIALTMKQFEGKRIKVTIEEEKKKRTNKQNGFYWAAVIPPIRQLFESGGATVDDEDVHLWLRRNVGKLTRVITDPDGNTWAATRSSTSLSTIEFEEYIEKIREWAINLGVNIPFPDEFYMSGI